MNHGIEFLDLFTPFEKASKAGIALFFRQDIHFSREGHALMAAVMAHAYPHLFSKGPE